VTGFPINPPRAQIVDRSGFVSAEWYRYFAQIQSQLGSAASATWQDGYLLGLGSLAGVSADDVQGGAGAIAVGTRTITSDYTVTTTDCMIRADATSSGITVLIPPAANYPGRVLHVKKIDASANTIDIVSSAGLIDGSASESLAAQWNSVSLIANGISWDLI
jgi:hypothetical protein